MGPGEKGNWFPGEKKDRKGKRERGGVLVGGSGTAKAKKLLSRWRFGSSLKLV